MYSKQYNLVDFLFSVGESLENFELPSQIFNSDIVLLLLGSGFSLNLKEEFST